MVGLVPVIALAACGSSSGGSDPESAGGAQTIQPTVTTPITTSSKPTPVPTRLVAGPLLLRVRGAPKPTATNSTPQLLYAMVFRLNREPRSHTGRGIPALDPHGNYSIINPTIGWGDENPILRLGDRHCFFGVFDSEDVPPQLREIHVGQRVRVILQPTTPTPNGGLRLGQVYERHPRLMLADFHFRNPRARAAMRRIGCPAVPLGPPG